jgi:hypothetical protein
MLRYSLYGDSKAFSVRSRLLYKNGTLRPQINGLCDTGVSKKNIFFTVASGTNVTEPETLFLNEYF